ncbi:MAG: PEP-CTERM sorting domain-containing protein [Syntrophobacteraceae bacterium]|nr:PEP-CTERM sorting domain-containing protein [Syntrophobacteraceae bacterium]
MRKAIIASGIAIALLATVGMARADSLYVGSSYTYPIHIVDNGVQKTVGGGSIDPSTLNGTLLKYMYCINPDLEISAGTTYANTIVTTNGVIGGTPGHGVTNAGQIAWLLGNYGTGGQGANAYALQVAIWHEEDSTITMDTFHSTAQEIGLYNSYLSSLGGNTGNVSDFLWITPQNSCGQIFQEQVGAVPEPPTLLLLGTCLAVFAALRLKARQAKG